MDIMEYINKIIDFIGGAGLKAVDIAPNTTVSEGMVSVPDTYVKWVIVALVFLIIWRFIIRRR